jgi:hypothetical protein
MTLIAPRKSNAVSGSEFINANMNVNRTVRETNILKEFIDGNIPDFLRKFAPITVTINNNTLTYLVIRDYLSIGSDSDYVRMPMNPLTAQKIADQYDCSLPTRKMVIDIWKQSEYKLSPLPWGPPYDASMMSTSRIQIHNQRIQNQLSGKDITKLISGHKKDVVLTNEIAPNNPNKKVAIFGWIQSNGEPIQGLNYWSHEDTYEDYSHGSRLIANDVMLNHKPMRLQTIFSDATLSALISDEGILSFQKY